MAIGLPKDELSVPARRGFLVTMVLCAGLIFVGFGFASRLAAWLARAEQDRDTLIAELNHRVKNTLGVVQSIVNQTFRTRADVGTIHKALDSRIVALAHAHEVLNDRNWQGTGLRETAEMILRPHLTAESRARLEGPDVKLSPRVAVVIALVLNEFVTNAAKYGALRTPTGEIELRWFAPRNGEMLLSWREQGGPTVVPPDHRGFGTQFIERCVTGELHGSMELSFPPSGVVCAMTVKV
jgi:two-component sensor histidine kinase